mmetsp:Transcript_19517/g.33129  ORF Transcript_19517/g.33129 Transcript_19517/m.33129 type:complete len:85 (-) Transcript_19517:626-880(-)
MWLFHQHSSVSFRIFYEDHADSAAVLGATASSSSSTAVYHTIWPSIEQCPECISKQQLHSESMAHMSPSASTSTSTSTSTTTAS